jgi:catechol 2,3-dioxygenase-like lactoylglutathione lyase family enzyme
MTIQIQSVMHVNVNCSDLEQSLAFYRDAIGLVPGPHTNPPPQQGFPLGDTPQIPDVVQWDAWILQDARGFGGPGVDVLQWRIPEPDGHPYPVPHHLGLTRIGISVPDIEAAHRHVTGLGHRCLSAPCDVPVGDDLSARVCVALDPDGSLIELVELADSPGPRLCFAEIVCRDLDFSLDWYERVLGLEAFGRCAPGPQPGLVHGLEGEVEWSAAYIRPPGLEAFGFDLVEWRSPIASAPPYPNANHIGLYRAAFLVADIQACHEALRNEGVDCPDPVFLDMGPKIPIDGVHALFFQDPDGTCLELIEAPKLD